MALVKTGLVEWTNQGLFCSLGQFYIDPHRAVENAVITHAHSDHARRGSQHYWCTASGVGLLKARIGKKIRVQGIPYRERFRIGDVEVSFHSAGHILGSAQIRIQHGSEVWVVSGDYKREPDPSCEPFEVVPCDTFITEATFGTPKYIWDKTRNHGRDIFDWWEKNATEGKNSILFGYSLGKSQRILAELEPYAKRPILIHSAMLELTQCYRDEGRKLAPTSELEISLFRQSLEGELILAPPSILERMNVEILGEYETAFASGWMVGSAPPLQTFGRAYNHGFVLSDHADWNDLNQTIEDTRAKEIFVLHRNGALIRHLRKKGLRAYPFSELTPAKYQALGEINLSFNFLENRPR
jgi:putative mRNA 3-end processing factor